MEKQKRYKEHKIIEITSNQRSYADEKIRSIDIPKTYQYFETHTDQALAIQRKNRQEQQGNDRRPAMR